MNANCFPALSHLAGCKLDERSIAQLEIIHLSVLSAFVKHNHVLFLGLSISSLNKWMSNMASQRVWLN